VETKLIKELFRRYAIKGTSGKSIQINSVVVTPRKVKEYFTPELAKACLNNEELIRYYEWKDGDIGEVMCNHIKSVLRKQALKKIDLEGTNCTIDFSKTFKFEGFIPISDIRSNKKALFDLKYNQISDLSYDAWEESLSKDKDIREAIMSKQMRGLLKYDPYTTERAQQVSHRNETVYQFNSHIFPEWRFKKIDNPEPPQFFFDLMEHLFPDEGSRAYVYFWLKSAILDRNQTILLLSSNMGTGKGTLMDILELLVGVSNFQKQGEGFFNTNFSGELVNKRVMFFDEVTISRRIKEKLKLFANNTIPIEKKGVDVQPAVDNFASIIVVNNHINENMIVADDRRFSVPEITNTPLLDRFSEKKVNKFHRELRGDPKVIESIGWWLIQNADLEDWDVHMPWKRERFYQMVKGSLAEWQKYVVDVVQSKKADKYSFIELREGYEDETGSRKFPGAGKMDSFLQQYKEMDGQIIGDVIKESGSYYVIPSNRFKKSFNEFMEI